MKKKKILFHTNNPKILTGLGENGKEIMKYMLTKCRDKYDFIYYCSQTSVTDPVLNTLPCKAYGCIPNDQNIINQMNQNLGLARDISYGSYFIEEIIKNEKPDIYLASDDIWAINNENYINKKWWNKLNSILHITIDSVPVLEQAFEQAKKTKNYITWAKFAAEEMKKYGEQYKHINQIYGAFDTSDFEPISIEDKAKWRKQFGIDDKTLLFSFLSRNQLRKNFPQLIEALAIYKKRFPLHNIKLHFHTSISEKANGWDIPKLMDYYGIKKDDILFTYVCKNCGKWHVKPYTGEDIDCPYCGAEKSMITANIVNGVPSHEMKYLYGIADATINAFTSGGLERSIVNSLLCGLPTAATNYSSGEDFCKQSFIYSLDYVPYYEQGTNFKKATTKVESIISFMLKIYNSTENEKKNIREKSRKWAVETFSTEIIGKQWENLFDSLPYINWDNFSFEDVKNEKFILPKNYQTLSEDDFLTMLYSEILGMNEPLNGSGRESWKQQMKNGISRENIYKFFIDTANKENQKNKKINFSDLIDKNTGRKRAIIIARESIGDLLILSSLFESFHEIYPQTDLYIATQEKYFEIFEGNPYVYKCIQYQDFMENELIMISAGQKKEDKLFDYYFHAFAGSQRHLSYLSRDKIAFDIKK